jgi:tetratricopeptide (TPR) repeat protein
MLVKAIFRVNLQFGTLRSYEQALGTYQRQVENLYKGEVCIKQEEVFNDATLSLELPNLVVMTLEKTIKNTAFLLENLAQYALSGKGYCWIMDNGRATYSHAIEPQESKSVIISYMKGCKLAKEAGHETQAIEMLSEAINKFDRHWTALERRGYVKGLLGDFDGAITDFNSSIAINPDQADAYFSRARVKMMQGNLVEAIEDFDTTWRNANPQLPLYWSARRVKAECCLRLERYADGAQELKFFTKQTFAEQNPNFPWRKSAWLNYSFALHMIKSEKEAQEAFKTAYKINDNLEPIIEGKLLAFCQTMSSRCGLKMPKIIDSAAEMVA